MSASLGLLALLLAAAEPDLAGSPPLPSRSVATVSDTSEHQKSAEPIIQTPSSPGAEVEDIVITGHNHAAPGDPLAGINTVAFNGLQAVDKAIVAPVAQGYKAVLPKPARRGVTNVLNNLDEPIVFLNFLLQLKPGKAMRTLARFTVNSTIGVGGLFDQAKKKPFNLPRRSNGLADTLGYYGVKPGPFLYLPIIGPTTLRDALSRPFDLALLPRFVGAPFTIPAVSISKSALSAIDERANDDDDTEWRKRHEGNDPYSAIRENYLKTRAAEIRILREEGGARKRLPHLSGQASEIP